MANSELFDLYFRRADLDGDGQISGNEAVAFFQGANLPQATLAKIWQFADQRQRGFLSRIEFHNALKLVTVAQTGRELTYELVRAALAGPAASQIPPPKIAAVTGPAAQPQPQAAAAAPVAAAPRYSGTPQVASAVRPPQAPLRQQTPPSPLPVAGSFTAEVSRQVGPGSFGGGVQRPSVMGMFTTEATRAGSFGVDSWNLKQPASAPLPASRSSANSLVKAASTPTIDTDAFDAFSGPGFKITPPSSTAGLLDAGLDTKPKPVSAPPQLAKQQQQKSSIPAVFGDSTFQADASSPNVPAATAPTQGAAPVARRPDVPSAFPGPGFAPPAMAMPAPWPKMTQADKMRYAKVFAEVDTDKDGKISGVEARDLFLGWRLPREVLKQVWDLSDQDGDSMLSLREFCTALYLMDRFREGRQPPPVLPPGFHIDDPATDEWQSVAASRIADAQAAMSQHSAGYNVPLWQQIPGLLQPAGGPVPAGAGVAQPPRPFGPGAPRPVAAEAEGGAGYKSRVPVLEPHLVAQLSKDEQETLNSKHQEAQAADRKVYDMDKDIMDSKEKIEFYKTKLQDIILLKTRCDNRLAETIERSASEKREVEILSKKYEEKFKQAGESNSRLQAEEAAFRDLQLRKMDLYNAIAKMDQGGDGNVMLQSQANRISDDLDELRKAFNERAKRLGLKVKSAFVTEVPFGWQPGLQESAEWDEDWDKFDDEGFTATDDAASPEVVQKSVDVAADKPVPAPIEVRGPISWDDGSFFDDGFEFPSESKALENGVDNDASEKLSSAPLSPSARSEFGSPKSVPESTLFSHQQFDGEPVEKEVVESATSRSLDAFSDSPLDIRSLHTSSPGRGTNGNAHSMEDFGGSFTVFASPKGQALDKSGFFQISGNDAFGGASSFANSPSSNKSFARTDTRRDAFSRFDSFASTRDAPRHSKFGSFDDDPFAGTGPFGTAAGNGGQTPKPSPGWSTF